jgi:hypothetical protein
MNKTTIPHLFGIFCLLVSTPLSSGESTEFTSLFNGKDLSGWVTVGTSKSFEVKDGAIRTTGAHPYPAWLRSEKEYENFVLRFSYKTANWYEGGVLLHAPLQGPGSKIGFKLHLKHDHKPYGLRAAGAIYDVASPLTFNGLPAGQWNQCQVICDWPKLSVMMNGKLVQDIDMSKNIAFEHRMRRGYIGLQNICDSSAF